MGKSNEYALALQPKQDYLDFLVNLYYYLPAYPFDYG
jgi:hypothetical protein